MSPNQHVLRFPATSETFKEAAAALRGILETQRLDEGPRYNVELAFEEVAANIIRHGSSSHDVEMTITFSGDEIVMTFEDDGVPFDPRERPDPPAPASIGEAPLGGLGLMLVRNISTRLAYTRTPRGRNHLTIAIPSR